MRYSSVIAVLACAAWFSMAGLWNFAGQSAAADQLPYTVYTNSNDVYVRSGPGKNYYPTDKLPQGQAVEVYRQDPGGWLAIRPPQGSFSWVQADSLKPIGDHLAIVQKDHAQCYVGTRFSNAHDVHQVRLDEGEKVEILDMKQVGDGPDAQTWCEVAPPSGEFRWVFNKFVDRDPPSGLSHIGDSDRSARQHDAWDDARGARSDQISVDHAPQQTEWTAKGSGGFAPASLASSKIDTGGVTMHDSNQRASSSRSADDASIAPTDALQAQLNAIDLQVSQMVVDDPSTWEFTALRRRTESLLPSADTALERGRIRLVLNRIARFEDVKHRQDLLGDPGSATASALASHRPSVLPTEDPDRFDSVGKLMPVFAQRPNAPAYALVDPVSNQVVSFISAAPGVNLQPYVGKEVGVNGQRGFMPELQKPHVTAMHVNILDDGPILR